MERPRSRFTPSLPAGRASRRSWLLGWWSLWRVPTLVTIVAALWWFGVRPIASEQGWVPVEAAFSLCGEAPRTEACVIDGDTVLITRAGARARRVRLTGFDTPELDGACAAERALAREARAALLDWLQRGPFEWNGADAPPYDRYGRELRRVRRVAADGTREPLAEALIDARLASESGWGSEPIDWCR